jgi:flagellar FliJ protein
MQQEEDRLSFFVNRRNRCQKELLDLQKEGVSPAEMSIYSNYMRFIKEKIEWQVEAVNTAKKHVDEKKDELLAAQRDRKILDRLRSRRYGAFLVDSRRKEMKQLDEVALGKFQAKNRERRE